MYPSNILTHAGINGMIGRKLPREDMMGGTNDVPLDPKTEVMLEIVLTGILWRVLTMYLSIPHTGNRKANGR